MYPELIRIGTFSIDSYSFMAALAFAVGTAVAYGRCVREGLDAERGFWLAPLVLVSAYAGARILFVLVNHRYFLQDPLESLRIWHGGLVGYGSLLAVPVGILYIRYGLKEPAWAAADAIAPAIPLGIAIYRTGCFLNGCCYGAPTDLPWGVCFPTAPGSARQHLPMVSGHAEGFLVDPLPRHPTQLYESASCLVLSAAMAWAAPRIRRRDGVLFFTFIGAYSMWRFLVETLRDDARGQLLLLLGSGVQDHLLWVDGRMAEFLESHPASFSAWLSTSQIISLCALAFSMVFIRRRVRKAPNTP